MERGAGLTPRDMTELREAVVCRRSQDFTVSLSKMFFKPKEHEPSHIHALYGEYMGEFNIRTMEMIQGDLPRKGQELVREWLSLHQDELQEMWESQNLRRLPPL